MVTDLDILTDEDENYRCFIGESIATGCVWGLESSDGWALSPAENGDLDIMPFWSQPELAKALCVEEWLDYKVIPLSLEEFLDDWLPGMHEDIILVGINWNSDMEGSEVEPLDLLNDFDQAMQGG